jgi:hypothetical protein
MGQMFDKTQDQMNNWRWDNPPAFGDEVNCSNLQTPSSEKDKHSRGHFSWDDSDDTWATFEQQSYWKFKPVDFLLVEPLNLDDIIDKDDDDEKWADSGVPSSGRGHRGMGTTLTTAKVGSLPTAEQTRPGKETEQRKGLEMGRRLRMEGVKGRGSGKG